MACCTEREEGGLNSGGTGRGVGAFGQREDARVVVDAPVGDAAEDFGDGGEHVAEGIVVVLYAQLVVGRYAGRIEIWIYLIVREAMAGVRASGLMGMNETCPSQSLINSRLERDIVFSLI